MWYGGAVSDHCFLIAMPQLQDMFFTKTITLLAEFTKDGAMGLILNRPLAASLTQVLGNEMPELKGAPVNLYWGGPVQNDRGWVLHEDASLAADSTEIDPGLFLTASSDVLKKLAPRAGRPDAPRFRFFLGYAGWGPGQLEQEMAASSWVTAPLNRSLMFDENAETLWERSLALLGVDPMRLATAPQEEAI
jgi:putative transcriptional regulator